MDASCARVSLQATPSGGEGSPPWRDLAACEPLVPSPGGGGGAWWTQLSEGDVSSGGGVEGLKVAVCLTARSDICSGAVSATLGL